MMKKFGFVSLFILLIFACSSDPVQKGDEAYQKGKYAEALKFYMEAQKSGIQTPGLKEKIINTKLQYGEMIYQRRKVLRVLEARYEEDI